MMVLLSTLQTGCRRLKSSPQEPVLRPCRITSYENPQMRCALSERVSRPYCVYTLNTEVFHRQSDSEKLWRSIAQNPREEPSQNSAGWLSGVALVQPQACHMALGLEPQVLHGTAAHEMSVMNSRFNGSTKLTTAVGLKDVAQCADLKRVLDKVSIAGHRQEYNLRIRSNLTYQESCFHSVDAGHSDIEQHDIGLEGCCQVNRFASIFCFADHAAIVDHSISIVQSIIQ